MGNALDETLDNALGNALCAAFVVVFVVMVGAVFDTAFGDAVFGEASVVSNDAMTFVLSAIMSVAMQSERMTKDFMGINVWYQ